MFFVGTERRWTDSHATPGAYHLHYRDDTAAARPSQEVVGGDVFAWTRLDRIYNIVLAPG